MVAEYIFPITSPDDLVKPVKSAIWAVKGAKGVAPQKAAAPPAVAQAKGTAERSLSAAAMEFVPRASAETFVPLAAAAAGGEGEGGWWEPPEGGGEGEQGGAGGFHWGEEQEEGGGWGEDEGWAAAMRDLPEHEALEVRPWEDKGRKAESVLSAWLTEDSEFGGLQKGE